MSITEIEIRPIREDAILSGRNCQILVDGVVVQGVTDISFEVDARSCGRITVGFMGNISIKGKFEDKNITMENRDG